MSVDEVYANNIIVQFFNHIHWVGKFFPFMINSISNMPKHDILSPEAATQPWR
jgi:hypothetical protein